MIYKKILPAIVLVALGTSLLAVTPAHAATNSTGAGNFFSGLVQYIAKTFGLDQTKVQTAVNTYNQQQKQNGQQNQKTKLDKLVSAKTITQSQEDAIIAELAVLKSKYNPSNFKSMTAAQRKQQFQNEQTDINNWAKAQGIDPKYLMPGFGGGGFRGMHKGWNAKPTPTPTS